MQPVSETAAQETLLMNAGVVEVADRLVGAPGATALALLALPEVVLPHLLVAVTETE